MSSKFKFVLFHFFGIGFLVLGAVLCTYIGKIGVEYGKSHSISGTIAASLFFFVIWCLLSNGLIGGAIMNGKKSIFNYLWIFRKYRNIKWIYHSELGYFPSVIDKKKLILYRQNIFTLDD